MLAVAAVVLLEEDLVGVALLAGAVFEVCVRIEMAPAPVVLHGNVHHALLVLQHSQDLQGANHRSCHIKLSSWGLLPIRCQWYWSHATLKCPLFALWLWAPSWHNDGTVGGGISSCSQEVVMVPAVLVCEWQG
jgi:hypothetical protein